MRSIRETLAFFVVLLTALLSVAQTPAAADSQNATEWHDPSPHKVQFVTVDQDVRLEVLDWGGTGRTVVLLAGLGNTAHVFDDFAPKLTPEYHVYGITRRGFGASSAPTPTATNYAADRLRDDVLAVLDALRLNRPVLVGHSQGGVDVSSVATRFPGKIAGAVYLDPGNGSFYDSSHGDLVVDTDELVTNLRHLPEAPLQDQNRIVQMLLQTDFPTLEKDLQEYQKALQTAPSQPTPQRPTASDFASFAAFRSWQTRMQGITFPEAELRQQNEARPDGGIGRPRTPPVIAQAINDGKTSKYTEIHVPALAIFGVPPDLGAAASTIPAARTALESWLGTVFAARITAFEKGVPSAHVVRLLHANHYVFLSNEADVLREMHAFLSGLPQ